MSEIFFWIGFVTVDELPRYLVYLPDGICRVTSPILKNKGKSYAVAKKNEKCQSVSLFAPVLGSLSPSTPYAGFH